MTNFIAHICFDMGLENQLIMFMCLTTELTARNEIDYLSSFDRESVVSWAYAPQRVWNVKECRETDFHTKPQIPIWEDCIGWFIVKSICNRKKQEEATDAHQHCHSSCVATQFIATHTFHLAHLWINSMVSWVGIKTKREVQLYKLLKWIHCQSFGERWFPPDLRIGELLNVHFFPHRKCDLSCCTLCVRLPVCENQLLCCRSHRAAKQQLLSVATQPPVAWPLLYLHSFIHIHYHIFVIWCWFWNHDRDVKKTIRLSTWYLKWIVYGWLLHVVYFGTNSSIMCVCVICCNRQCLLSLIKVCFW